MSNEFWVATARFTCYVRTDKEGIIVETAPILKKFVGQPVQNLYNWISTFEENFTGPVRININDNQQNAF